MSYRPQHIQWLVDSGERFKIADGKDVEIWNFHHQGDDSVLSSWAKHFRNHYCLDSKIDLLRGSRARSDYLTHIKFPSKTSNLGRSIRAGDFGEILVADYLQWILGYWVPRVRWGSKIIRDESPKGSDVIGFRFRHIDGRISVDDDLFVFEAKTMFSASGKNCLQNAINDSAKSQIRIDESLNYLKQKLLEEEMTEQGKKIERFQNPTDMPYQKRNGAAAVISDEHYDPIKLSSSDSRKVSGAGVSGGFSIHPNAKHLFLLIMKGQSMMRLVHELYERAASEA